MLHILGWRGGNAMNSLVLWSDPTGRVVVNWNRAEPGVSRYEMFVCANMDAKGICNGHSTFRGRTNAIAAAKRKARQLAEADLLDALRSMVDRPPGDEAYMVALANARAVIALAEATGIGRRCDKGTRRPFRSWKAGSSLLQGPEK
jgi:hypothetical protein